MNTLFINNDCECLNDVLEPLIKYIEDFGLLTGKVRGLDGKYTGTHKLFPAYQEACWVMSLQDGYQRINLYHLRRKSKTN